MKQITIIGDIHGCFDTFLELLNKIPKEDQIVLCGDLVDRGPKSRQLVTYIMEHPEILCVKGNHEDMMEKDILGEKTPYEGEWFAYQGKETIDSYKGYAEVMKTHAEWMNKLPLFLEFSEVKNSDGRYLVVSHSSIGSTWKFKDPSHQGHHFFKKSAVWNRDPPNDIQDIYNVFGHTPCYMEPKIKSFYANIDTGCCFNRPGYDKLTALRFPSMEIIQQRNIDKHEI